MRYFFNIVRAGITLRDMEGTELGSDGEAEAEARSAVRDLIGRELIGGRDVDWSSSLEVWRAGDTVVAVLSFLEAAQVLQIQWPDQRRKSQPNSRA